MAGSWLVTDTGIRWDPGIAGMNSLSDHTELNGTLGWVVPGGNGIYETRPGYRIVSKALEDSSVGHGAYLVLPSSSTGYYIIATLGCSNWAGKPMGLKIHNIVSSGSFGSVDGRLGTGAWDLRTGTTVVLSGSVGTGIPSVTNSSVDVGFGWRANLGIAPAPVGFREGRFGFAVELPSGSRQNVMAEDAMPYSAVPTDLTYPGIVQNNAPIGSEWNVFTVYQDWALTFRFLEPGWGIKIVDVSYSTGTTFLTADTAGECRWTVPIGINPPVSNGTQITLYSDAGTWATPVPGGDTTVGALAFDPFADLIGAGDTVWPGAVIDWEPPTSIDRVGILVNWENDDDWIAHDADDVTSQVFDIDLSIVAANPRIEVDTLTITLKDPFGDYVPANINSLFYPNVRLARQLRWNLTIDGITECRFHGAISEYTPLLGDQSSTSEQQCRIRAESPLRALASAQVPLTSVPSGVLVNPDGVTGVIPTLLGLVASIIPSNTWALDPTPDSIDPGFLTVGMTIQTALEQCAIFADSIYCIRPHYRTALGQPKFYFVWKARGITHAAFADHVWTDVGGDIGQIIPRYTGDII